MSTMALPAAAEGSTTAVDLRRELHEQERQIVEAKRLAMLAERRRLRRRVALERKAACSASDDMLGVAAQETLEAIASRPGFLQQQLATECQRSPLWRWHVQLKLLVAQDAAQHDDAAGSDRNSANAALAALEAALVRDRRCYDVSYRRGARVQDAWENLVDGGAQTAAQTRELLCFSTRVDGTVCRVTCLSTGPKLLFSSSPHVKSLQTQFQCCVEEDRPVQTAIAFIWRSMKS